MKKLEHDLLTNKYTTILHEDKEQMKFNAPHNFLVLKSDYQVGEDGKPRVEDCVGGVSFQEGPIKEVGVNGVMNEDLISMVICRLDHFQDSEFACYENDMAIVKLEEALLWLRKRTMGRENRGVEGTHKL